MEELKNAKIDLQIYEIRLRVAKNKVKELQDEIKRIQEKIELLSINQLEIDFDVKQD